MPDDKELYIVYMFSGTLFFQSFDARKRKVVAPTRDANLCPEEAYGFYYAVAPAGTEVKKMSDLKLLRGCYFVDAILIPTARLESYLKATGAYHDVKELHRNSDGAQYHAHTRCGRFFSVDLGKGDRMLSTCRSQGDTMDRASGRAIAA